MRKSRKYEENMRNANEKLEEKNENTRLDSDNSKS